jgi:hypothetical protein
MGGELPTRCGGCAGSNSRAGDVGDLGWQKRVHRVSAARHVLWSGRGFVLLVKNNMIIGDWGGRTRTWLLSLVIVLDVGPRSGPHQLHRSSMIN